MLLTGDRNSFSQPLLVFIRNFFYLDHNRKCPSPGDACDMPPVNENKSPQTPARRASDPAFSSTVDHLLERIARFSQENPALLEKHADLKEILDACRQVIPVLETSEQNLEALLTSFPHPVHVVDTEGTVLQSNHVTPENFGINGKEFVGKNIFSLLSPEDAAKRKEYLERILATGKPLSWEDMREDRYYHNFAFPIFDPAGKVNRIAHIALDITDRKNIETALQESEEKYRTFIDLSPDAVMIIQDRKIVYANSAAAALYAIPDPKEFIGKGIYYRLHPKFEEIVNQNIRDALEGKKPPLTEVQIVLADGSVRTIEGNGNRIFLSGKPAIQVSLRDVTGKKQMEEALRDRVETERALINSPADMAVLLDPEGTILNINDNFARLLGRSPPDLLGSCVWDLMPPEVTPTRRNYFDQAIQSHAPVRFEEQRGPRWYDSEVNPVLSRQGTVLRLAVMARDITERKIAEEQLKEYSETLKRSNEDLELFAVVIAHDLQEPIRTIIAYTQLLLTELKPGTKPSMEKYLRIVEKSGLKMHRLLTDLREYSSVRYRQILTPTNMEEALERALDDLRPTIRQTHAAITSDRLPTVLADQRQIVQVFSHLIDNAIKFRKEGIPPHIHVSVSPVEGLWKFSVRDNGIGIPSRYFDKIFIIFEQLSRKDTDPGTGLGLALCKRIIERHGGNIWVESEEGTGTTVFFTLKA